MRAVGRGCGQHVLCAAAVVWLAVGGRIVSEVDGATFSNLLPRRDINGAIVNAHDGQIMKENGTYYWFAAGYVALDQTLVFEYARHARAFVTVRGFQEG